MHYLIIMRKKIKPPFLGNRTITIEKNRCGFTEFKMRLTHRLY